MSESVHVCELTRLHISLSLSLSLLLSLLLSLSLSLSHSHSHSHLFSLSLTHHQSHRLAFKIRSLVYPAPPLFSSFIQERPTLVVSELAYSHVFMYVYV